MTYVSQKLRSAAKGEMCVGCGAQDETVVMAHLAWPGIADKGIGVKCDDFAAAHLCAVCHRAADGGAFQKDLFWRYQMTMRTLRRLFANGTIRV